MRWLTALLFPFALGLGPIQAAPLRVTTWNLNFRPVALASPADTRRLAEIASILESLNADMVLLQEVPDRETCEKLAALLQTARYQVAVCSAFTDVSGHKLSQVAILTRQSVVASGTESWKPEKSIAPPGGFAWVAVRRGATTIVACSVQLKENTTNDDPERDTQINILTRELAAGQLVQLARSIERDLDARPTATLIGGSLNTDPDQPEFVSENTLRLFQDDGFKSAWNDLPLPDRITRPGDGRVPDATSDYILVRGASFLGTPIVVPSDVSNHLPVTGNVVVPMAAPVAVAPAIPAPPTRWLRPWLLGPAVALPLLFVVWWFTARKRFYSPARLGAAGRERLLVFPDEETDAPAGGGRTREDTAAGLPLGSLEGDPAQFQILTLERRALAAEERAARATEMMRRGLIPHLARLMKDRLFHGVASQRAQLLAMQQAGAVRVAELEQRLAAIQIQLQTRLGSYEKRIAELEQEVAAKDQANRELLAARARMLKQALEDTRAQQEETQKF
jgi:endonuclease/exonuclease/phosphatase family metal-dependent hydrolase